MVDNMHDDRPKNVEDFVTLTGWNSQNYRNTGLIDSNWYAARIASCVDQWLCFWDKIGHFLTNMNIFLLIMFS